MNQALADIEFWTVVEAAALMRVSKMTVYRLVNDGRLESRRIGRSIRIPEQAIRTYLDDLRAADASQTVRAAPRRGSP